jgi:hypothetical protein
MNNNTKMLIETTLRHLVKLLVSQEYIAIENLTHGTRLKATEIESGIQDYGRTLVSPPPNSYSKADVIAITESIPPQYSVRFRLYTQEEGLSDLEIQATFIDAGGDQMVVELDNILVA